MSDHWDDWPDDGAEFDTADLGDPPDPADDGDTAEFGGYPTDDVEGFGPADDTGPTNDGGSARDGGPADEPGGPGPTPFGYGGLEGDADDLFDPYAEPAGTAGMGPAEEPVGVPADPPVGADPDLAPYTDSWPEAAFPDPLGIDPPEPVDGFPWTDPAALGDPAALAEAAGSDPAGDPPAGAPTTDELAGYAATELPPDTDPWAALAASEDPATSTLARFWGPEHR